MFNVGCGCSVGLVSGEMAHAMDNLWSVLWLLCGLCLVLVAAELVLFCVLGWY